MTKEYKSVAEIMIEFFPKYMDDLINKEYAEEKPKIDIDIKKILDSYQHI